MLLILLLLISLFYFLLLRFILSLYLSTLHLTSHGSMNNNIHHYWQEPFGHHLHHNLWAESRCTHTCHSKPNSIIVSVCIAPLPSLSFLQTYTHMGTHTCARAQTCVCFLKHVRMYKHVNTNPKLHTCTPNLTHKTAHMHTHTHTHTQAHIKTANTPLKNVKKSQHKNQRFSPQCSDQTVKFFCYLLSKSLTNKHVRHFWLLRAGQTGDHTTQGSYLLVRLVTRHPKALKCWSD